MSSVGIIGLGTYLPPIVRTNDYWSPNVVADWERRTAAKATRADAPPIDDLGPGLRRTLGAMKEYASDPFRGAVERRVMPDDMTVNEMEAHAAREAIARAGITVDEIDVILTQTPIPEHLVVNGACVTHQLLRLPRRCIAIATNVACNALALHASLAKALIATGQARNVLSVHSSAMARVSRAEEPDSAWWGDAASAVVFGPVSEGRGIISIANHADGGTCNGLVLGVPNKRWWDDGSITYYSYNRDHTRAMLLNLVDRAGEAIGNALGMCDAKAADVDFYASHQGTVWFTRETAAHAGLEHAKTIATFPAFGNLNSANIPLILSMAEREHMLRDDALVVTFAGGVGETWSAMCLRWGR
jgi:3-oxoacyl-[acyl-carrier-protein] synthase III